MILDINVGAMLVARTPDRIRGRANGAFRFINMGIRPIGATVGGILGGILGGWARSSWRPSGPLLSCTPCAGRGRAVEPNPLPSADKDAIR